jgi:hypothetical protein
MNEYVGQRARRLLEGRLIKWRGKTLEQLSDDECYDCLQFIQQTTGIYYVS